jgi:hypothetical protein
MALLVLGGSLILVLAGAGWVLAGGPVRRSR